MGTAYNNLDAEIKENEKAMRKDIKQQAAEMLESAGFRNVREYDNEYAMGLAIHEMGTARMGRDPKTSLLNKYNQLHASQRLCNRWFSNDILR